MGGFVLGQLCFIVQYCPLSGKIGLWLVLLRTFATEIKTYLLTN